VLDSNNTWEYDYDILLSRRKLCLLNFYWIIKAKKELDGQTHEGRILKIRFAPISDAAVKVNNLAPCVSNELLK